jgi:hypothetical protein
VDLENKMIKIKIKTGTGLGGMMRKKGGNLRGKGKELEKIQDSGFGESQEDMEEDAGVEGTLQEIYDEIPIAVFHPTKGFFSSDLKKVEDHTYTVNSSEVLMLNKEIEQKITSDSQLSEVLDNEGSVDDRAKMAPEKSQIEMMKQRVEDQTFCSNKEINTITNSRVNKNSIGLDGMNHFGGRINLQLANQEKGDQDLKHMLDDFPTEGNEEDWHGNIMEQVELYHIEEDGEQECEKALSKKGKKKSRRNFPVIATRASSRIARDGIPILEKATKRAREKNQLQGTSRPNPFLILNNESNENMYTVMKDIGIVLENYDNQIDVFKAEEHVRATIAEANYNKYVDKINSKNAPQTEENLQELAMEAITNKERLEAPLISQEGPGGLNPRKIKRKGDLGNNLKRINGIS